MKLEWEGKRWNESKFELKKSLIYFQKTRKWNMNEIKCFKVFIRWKGK